MATLQQNPDGSWTPAEPIGWREEHNSFQRLIFRIRGIEHCTDAAEAAYAARPAAKRAQSGATQ